MKDFIKNYEDDLIKEFLNAETEKDYNNILETWYNVYRQERYYNGCSYSLFIYGLLNWWFITEKKIY